MNKAKKILALTLSVLMLLSMVACGGGNGGQVVNPGASIKLKFVAADFGYGTGWLKAIAVWMLVLIILLPF